MREAAEALIPRPLLPLMGEGEEEKNVHALLDNQ
jgi:hypothetical protein